MILQSTRCHEHEPALVIISQVTDGDVDYDLLSQSTDGYSGSDLKELCRAALLYPVQVITNKTLEYLYMSPNAASASLGFMVVGATQKCRCGVLWSSLGCSIIGAVR